jgi:hypothetical protein
MGEILLLLDQKAVHNDVLIYIIIFIRAHTHTHTIFNMQKQARGEENYNFCDTL